MPETGFFRGAGGSIFEMDLPLSEPTEYQLTRGQLVRVNRDGSGYEPPVEVEAEAPAGDEPLAEAEPSTVDAQTEPPADTRRPAVNASKNEWVGYAVSQGMSVDDADAMTKADLIEKLK